MNNTKMEDKTNTSGIDEENIKLWQTKKLVKYLDTVRGSGTSMISIIIQPGDQISRTVKMLTDEYGTASNIKSRVNRQSVLDAITKAQVHLKGIRNVPPNGLVLYVGTIETEQGDKEVKYVFEPPKPINTSLYLCDSRFHTENLNYLFEEENKFGFIIMDGSGTLFGILSGSTRNILSQFAVDLPKKHGRGGQSSVRFARLRMEKRHNYVRKVAETAVNMFITQDKVNVNGLILAGSADFKTELSQSDMFDPRLQAKIIKIVDISYGGEAGFIQAINLSLECLHNVKFVKEKKEIDKFFNEININSGKYCFGVKDTFQALESGACDDLIVWEELKINRIELKIPNSDKTKILYLTPEQEANQNFFRDESGLVMEIISKELLTDWLALNYKQYGTTLHIVSDRTSEGTQFCRGFGGFGGILRYKINFDEEENNDDEYDGNADNPY